jgi:hypothetical protein
MCVQGPNSESVQRVPFASIVRVVTLDCDPFALAIETRATTVSSSAGNTHASIARPSSVTRVSSSLYLHELAATASDDSSDTTPAEMLFGAECADTRSLVLAWSTAIARDAFVCALLAAAPHVARVHSSVENAYNDMEMK